MELRKDSLNVQADTFLAGGGEMGALIRSKDWSNTPLGQVESWSQSLRSAAGIMLNSRYPIALYWGPELALLYNDAWSPIPGSKHPRALGHAAREVWPEIWDEIGPLFEHVFVTGEGTWSEDQLLSMNRHGYTEECYFNFTFSPIRGEGGAVEGVFNAVIETTERVLSERRLRTLSDLSARVQEARHAEEACERAARILEQNAADVPFGLIYLCDEAGAAARLVATANIEPAHPAAPSPIDLSGDSANAVWPLRAVADMNEALEIQGATARLGSLPGGLWPEAVADVIVLPLVALGQVRPTGFLIAGVNPRRRLDPQYRSFFDLVAGHLQTAVANTRAYDAERQRAETLAEIDRAKTAFFSNVSHEFRTPLTLMLGPLEEVLADDPARLPERRGELDVAHRNGLRLLKLVNSLLDFSRIEAGRMQASYQPTDLASLTAELVSNFRSACERAGLRLVKDCPRLPEPVYVDRDMWEKIVLNLLSNAFKFTFDGEIAVRLSNVNGAAELAVRDTGVGVPEHELPRLFERFHRIEGQKSRTYEGSGIGLALVQELIKLHGGTIRAESAMGQGTGFTVRIPFGTAHLPAERIGVEQPFASTSIRADAFVEEALRWLPDSAVRAGEAPGRAEEPDDVPRQCGARVLLAEDNADMRAYVRRLLGVYYVVDTVADGQAALEAIRARRPDLVLADVMMPRLDGFGLLRAIRADSDLRDLPVIMLSARAGEESRVEGLEAGASDYLTKPFGARELLARVEVQLAIASLQREVIRSEEFNQRLLESSQDCIKVLDLDGRLLSINEAGREHLEVRDLAALLNTCWLDLWREGNQEAAREAMANALAGAVGRFFGFASTQAGTPKWWDVVVTPMRNTQGKPERLLVVSRDMTARKQAEDTLQEETRALAALDRIGRSLSAELDLERLVQAVTDAATKVSGAAFGSFFYNVVDESGETYTLYTLSGAPREAFADSPMPRNTTLFAPTFAGTGVVRLDDVRKDPRFGKNPPYHGMPPDHLPVCSYLAVPVISRSGEVLGGLFFGHPEPGVFTERTERVVTGIAAQAAIAIDNARLYQAAQREITERKWAEEALRRTAARDAFRVALSDALRPLTDPAEIQTEAARVLGRYLGASRVHYAEVAGDDAVVHRGYSDGGPSVAGRYRLSAYGFFSLNDSRVERTIILSDAASDPRLGLEERAAFAALGVSALVSVPLVKGGGLAAILSVQKAEPHAWTDEEVALVGETAERTWAALEQAQAEQALHESEERYRRLVGLLPVAVYTCEAPSGGITFYNDHAAELWGRVPKIGDTDERFCGSFKLWRPDGTLLPHDQAPMALAVQGGCKFRNQEVVIERPDGTRIAVLVNIDPVRDESGQVVSAINAFTDVTARRKTEQLLVEQKRLLEMIAVGAPLDECLTALCAAVARLNPHTRASILLAEDEHRAFPRFIAPDLSPSFAQGLKGASSSDLASGTFGDAVLRGKPATCSDIANDPKWSQEWRDLCGANSILACHSAPILGVNGLPLGSFMLCFGESRGPSEWERRLVDLGTYIASIALDRDRASQTLRESERHLRTLSQSLERRVEARTAELQRQTARLRRLAGELTSAEQRERKRLAAILHDGLQQLLVAAKMRLGQIHGQVRDPAALSALEGVADMLSQAVDSSRNLTRQLRPPVLYEGGLMPALRWLASELVRLHGLHVVIDGEDAELPLSDDLKALLFESIRELLFNVAKHAGASEAAVRVWQSGQRLQIAVEDEGVGFDVEAIAQEQEQDPQQAGMGLFSIRERLAALGGDVAVESILGEGTRIWLAVPLAPAAGEQVAGQGNRLRAAAIRSEAVGLAAADRQARVLVVDDHAIVREGIANVLSGDKRLVVVGEAADGMEAIEAVERHQPDVVLIDVNMPRMNGVEATREIRRRWPEVRIVALSVQDDAATARTMINAGAAAFVSKSDDAGQMIHAVLAPSAED